MQAYQGAIEDQAGNVLSGWSVQVNFAGTTNTASIFSDNAFTPLANPFINNTDGTFKFYSAMGRYDVVLTKTNSGFTIPTIKDILLQDIYTFITPAAITGNTNNYSPVNGTQVDTWRISATNPFNITGILAALSNQNARQIYLTNVGAPTITFTNKDVNSSAANQIITGTGASVTLAQDQSITMYYDQVTLSWRIIQ